MTNRSVRKNGNMDVDIELNNNYSLKEIEEIFNTNFGSRIKGITLRKWNDRTPYILLFSRRHGPYSDKIEGNIFYYDGEGKDKDQCLTAANKALIESNKTGRIIFGFRQGSEGGKWRYLGILNVFDVNYVQKNQYKVYEFKLRIEDIEVPEIYSPELKSIIDASNKENPNLTEDNVRELITTRKVRDSVFRKKIKELYDNTCAVCKKMRFTSSHYPEVEAAHIFPKEKNGSDDLRNGISLCKLHHWAFDGGLFSINDDYSIVVKEDIKKDSNYKEIFQFENMKINLPNNSQYNPHKIFLSEHRKIHGYE
jgi:putative restriction endonuclease